MSERHLRSVPKPTFIVSKTNNKHYWAWRCLRGACDAGDSHCFSENIATSEAERHACTGGDPPAST